MNEPASPEPPRVHGLDGDTMPADWPPLALSETTRLLARYPDVGQVERISWHSSRPLSAAALVDTSQRRLFIKRHHLSVRTPATLGEEHAFMAHLRAAGAPVTEVFADCMGQTAVAHGEWVYEVHACAEGIDLYRDLVSWSPLLELEHARALGRAMAGLHQAAEGYTAPQRDTFILVSRDDILCSADPIATLQAQLPQRQGLADFFRGRDWRNAFESVLLPRQQDVQPRLASCPRLWTHNDLHASNLAWTSRRTDARVSTVFDFGLASPAFALYDLATAIERNAIAWLELDRGAEAVHIDTALALIDGYRHGCKLDSADLALLADLLTVVHIDFALSEIEYFQAITDSASNAEIAWDAFLLGHARWFDTAPARALLDAIAAA